MAKLLCVAVLIPSAITSWPAPFLYGDETMMTEHANITGTRCYEDDRFKGTHLMAYYNLVLMALVVVILTVLCVLYTLIWRSLKKTYIVSKRRLPMTDLPNSSEVSQNYPTTTSEVTSSSLSTELTVVDGCVPKHRRIQHKTTKIFILITLIFAASFLPHLVLMTITFLDESFVGNMTFSGRLLYNTFLWCIFINNMANPFLYGFLDRQFRLDLKDLYKSMGMQAKKYFVG